MSARIQIAIDCAEPHELAEFWAATLGHEVEDHSAQIGQLMASGDATDGDRTT